MRKEVIEKLRLRTADLSVGGSTVRGTGRKGTANAIRKSLKEVQLSQFASLSCAEFQKALDRETERVKAALPRGARQWGLARKVLNIYLMSAVSNRHLCAAFHLTRIEPWLEIPLDSYTGKGIHSTPEGASLARWKTIKGLQPKLSTQYQECGQAIARRLGVLPVHLEYLLWRR